MGAGVNTAENLVLQGFALYVRNNLCADLSQCTVKHSKHGGLADVSISAQSYSAHGFILGSTVSVHPLRIWAAKGFIAFNWPTIFTAELGNGVIPHGLANPMKHEPCRLLRDSERPVKLVRANAILAVADHPDRYEPLVQAKSGVLKDRAHLDRELLLAGVAEPDAASFDERVLRRSAARAGDVAAGPAQMCGILKGVIFVRELRDCLLKCLWFLHVRNRILKPHVCQVFYCRSK